MSARKSKSVEAGWRPAIHAMLQDPEKRKEVTANMSRAAKERAVRQGISLVERLPKFSAHKPSCRCAAHLSMRMEKTVSLPAPKKSTTIEAKLVALFLADYPVVETEKKFGRKRVDAYLPPPYHVAVEFDGREHRSLVGRSRDYLRDKYLFDNFGVLVLHIPFDERNLKVVGL